MDGDTDISMAIFGGGNMGAALLAGLLNGGPLGAHDLVVVEPSAARRAELEAEFPGVAMVETCPPITDALIAVKPQHVADAIAAAADAGARRVLSVAAGVTTAAMASAADTSADEAPLAFIRAMPNTPALVGEGVTAICAGSEAGEEDLAWAESMLASTGHVFRVEESQIDAVTGLTGSGPAYLFLVAEALIDAGRTVGLPEPMLEPMVTQLFVGAAALLEQRGDPAALRVAVTSPGGTTAAGLASLTEADVPSAFVAAVTAATHRSQELGAENQNT